MSEIMNEVTNGTNGIANGIANGAPKTAHEVALAYEAAMGADASAADSAPSEPPSADSAPTRTDDNVEAATNAAPDVPAAPVMPAPSLPEDLRLRLRMKVWIDRATLKRYLMPSAFMRDVVNGRPVTDVMYAYAMSDEDTKLVTITAGEWNTLPFFYFQEDGPAPRMAARPADVVTR